MSTTAELRNLTGNDAVHNHRVGKIVRVAGGGGAFDVRIRGQHETLTDVAASCLERVKSEAERKLLDRMEGLLKETAVYATVGEQRTKRWNPPYHSKARQWANRRVFLEGRGRWLRREADREVGHLGIGVELYFVLMRGMAKLFTWLCVVHAPVLLLGHMGIYRGLVARLIEEGGLDEANQGQLFSCIQRKGASNIRGLLDDSDAANMLAALPPSPAGRRFLTSRCSSATLAGVTSPSTRMARPGPGNG